ncbi:GRAM domain-containing protein 2B isoform X2 [Lepisosteus oculatus]|uniref:GRAM domain-containing protein 2B isoform X2 n=1 Tax=Lepisosteus oculatus TaxID=7918 RepID=UPI00073FC512|nr:PREDICTED: GRAM domain-containing protein 3-like isoform X2 [Lepisosteus oculatus]
MLESKREALKTILKKIDERGLFGIKHLMKQSYQAESGGGLAMLKKGKSRMKIEPRKAQSLEEAQLEMQQFHKALAKQGAPRSQTFDCTYEKPLEKTEGTGSVSRNSFVKHNKTFHKLFQDVPEHEALTHTFTCALQKEVPYHGKMFVSENFICFYSSVLLKDTKVVIPVSLVAIIKKQNTALLVPNALSIRRNDGEKFVFVSLRNRESCFKLLKSLCSQYEDLSTNSSPVFSSAENSLEKGKNLNSSQSSLEDSNDQSIERNSTFSKDVSPIPKVNKGTKEYAPALNASTPTNYNHEDQTDSVAEPHTGASWVWSVTQKAKSFLAVRETTAVNVLLLIYLMLVVVLLLSSGYIGLRIVALEEQLTSMGALPEFSMQSEYKKT